jgi:hypothetical protein
MKETEEFIQHARLIFGQIEDGQTNELVDKDAYFKILWIKETLLLLPHTVSDAYYNAFNMLKAKSQLAKRIFSGDKIEEIFDGFPHRMHLSNDMLGQLPKEIRDLFVLMKRLSMTKFLVIIPLINIHALEDFKLGSTTLTNLTESKIDDIQSSIYNYLGGMFVIQ